MSLPVAFGGRSERARRARARRRLRARRGFPTGRFALRAISLSETTRTSTALFDATPSRVALPRAPVRAPRIRDMGGARRVPWRDWAEWDRVRSGLCGHDPEARDASIARVADWRRRGRVPHAVDCTASLLETRALDAGVPGNVTGGSGANAPLSENMLRLAYAAALVRMVNGAVDPSQKGKYAAPVMTLAKRMGIPAVLVDVRMAASHQEMPALALLRHASERALQWLFERYWHAQANQLRELRRGARLAAKDLVAAEAARRAKAERTTAFRKAERGKGEAKTRARNGGVHLEEREDGDEEEDRDDDDDDDDDATETEREKDDENEGSPPSPRRARRSATNRLFAAASREDSGTCAEALLSVAVDVSRSSDEEGSGSSPTLSDWRAVATRLLKRWPTLDEALLLKAAEAALELGSPSRTDARESATASGDARARVAAAAAALFAETSDKTAPPPKKKRARSELSRGGGDEDENENEQSDAESRRAKTHWYLTRRALAFANEAVMTDARRAFALSLVNTAPGASRSFKAAAARLLGDGGPGRRETLASARLARDGASGDDDDAALLSAARRGLAKNERRGHVPEGTADRADRGGPPDVASARSLGETSGVFEKVSDWTPCAVGDLPAHLRGGDVGPRRADAADALRLAEAVSASAVSIGGKRATADLLWARWPPVSATAPNPARGAARGGFAGFGFVSSAGGEDETEPATNYAAGAPFADETRRALAGPGDDSRDGSDYVPDEAVASAGEMASGRFLCAPSRDDDVDAAPARVSARRAASLVFVDLDDDSDTEPMGGASSPRSGEEIDATATAAADDAAFGNADDDSRSGSGSGRDSDSWNEREDARDAETRRDDEVSTDGPTDDGITVRVGGMRVRLSASDRDAVAADVECLV